MRPNTLMNCDFMSILDSELLREYKKAIFKLSILFPFSMYDLLFHKGCKPQLT